MDYFFSFNKYLKEQFNDRLWRIPLSTGYPCPNRLNGKTGCTFCNETSFIPRYLKDDDTLDNQIERGIKFFSKRYKVNNFYGYFQYNTSTFGPVDELIAKYEKVLSLECMKGLIISTRPDYITIEIVDKINNLYYKYKKDIWIELGLQSIYDRTLSRINRGHTYDDFKIANKLIKESENIKTSIHIIIGLPGETEKMIEEGIAKLFKENKIDGIKFRLLEILPNTLMEDDFNNNSDDFLKFTFDSYCKLLARLIEVIPENVVIMRLVNFKSLEILSNGQKNISKREVLEAINRELEGRGSRQGALYKL